MPVAPRIVNDVAYVMRINHEIHERITPKYIQGKNVTKTLLQIKSGALTPKCTRMQFAHQRDTYISRTVQTSVPSLNYIGTTIGMLPLRLIHVSETEGGCFFSIGPSVLIGLCSLYRVETSAPGLSGYYWYTNIHHSCSGLHLVSYSMAP